MKEVTQHLVTMSHATSLVKRPRKQQRMLFVSLEFFCFFTGLHLSYLTDGLIERD